MKSKIYFNPATTFNIALILIGTTLLQCSGDDDVGKLLKDSCRKDLINGLKSPNSYVAGPFRFVSTVRGKDYPGIIDSLYLNSRFMVVNGDTVYTTRFTVVHLYLAKNPLGVESKGMVRAEYNSLLKLLSIRDWSEREERNEVESFKQDGMNIEELKWEK